VDEKHAILKTLLEQSLDSVNKLNNTMGGLSQTVQQAQATTGARMDSMGTQVQGLLDNIEEVKSRVGKLNQQMVDTQSALQSIDAKLGGGSSAPAGGAAGAAGGAAPAQPPPSADVLYANAQRDFTSGKYDISRQEFADYLKYYADTDLAGNAQFYLGEISYAQGQYGDAVAAYDKVLLNYPKSYKLAPARLKKGLALLEMGQKASATRELREVMRRHPGTEEARRASLKLREIGASPH
jgi:tol-pal system protein YbgF